MAKHFWRGALGAFALGALACAWIERRVRRWETLAPTDAPDGAFFTLPAGARMHYVQRGARGRDVILIHGFLGSAYDWFGNLDALSGDYRVWALDLIGFGYSERVTERAYSLKTYARHVREFMDAHNIAQATLVGHSMGGAIALEFAHDYPDRVDRLALVAPATYLARVPAPLNLAARTPLVPRTLIGWAITSPLARRLTWRYGLGDAPVELAEVAISRRAWRVKGTTDALVALIGSPCVSDLVEGMDKIAHPTLILSGEQDLVVPDWHSRLVARRLPNADIVTLPGVRHAPQIETPATVNRLLLDFFKRTES